MTPRIGSLCSGYGGLDLGLIEVVGGTVAWHFENDKHPSAVLEERWPGVPNYGDLTAVDWTQVEPVEWLTAGYPCPPFSYAGKRKGSLDERHLWPAVARAIGVLRPRWVLLENVRGHVSLGLDAVLSDLAELGYDATWGVVRASDAGACHGRARVFVAAAHTATGGWRWPEGVERGLGSAQCITATSADASRGPFAGPAEPRDGLSVAAECGDESAADAYQQGRQGTEPARRHDVSARRIAADTDDDATRAGRQAGDSRPGRAESAQLGSGAAADATGARRAGSEDERAGGGNAGEGIRGAQSQRDGVARVEWGVYEPAIRRWEQVVGRPAPRPTEPGRTGERLNPRFVEWMQGLSAGWVTDILSRNPALKCLGNGVVPQQAALALRLLLPRLSEAAA